MHPSRKAGVSWMDLSLRRFRVLVWRWPMWQWRPILDRDFYGDGHTVFWWGPLWMEW